MPFDFETELMLLIQEEARRRYPTYCGVNSFYLTNCRDNFEDYLINFYKEVEALRAKCSESKP